jgi:hypothetical protein
MDRTVALIETIKQALGHGPVPAKAIEMKGGLQIDSDVEKYRTQ